MNNKFPTDPIEAGTAKLRYGLDAVTWRKVRRRIDGWHPEDCSTEFHSEAEVLRALADISVFEPGELLRVRPRL